MTCRTRFRVEGLFRVAEFETDRAFLAERDRPVEARASPGAASAGALLFDAEPKRVLIAVNAQLDHALAMIGLLALFPQAFARAAVIPCLAALDGVVGLLY
jgi:hypothetical protein